MASHENWPKRIKLMPHYQIKYVSNYLFPFSLFQKMDTYNESRINTPNMTFQTPTFSISVALSISTILIGSIVTFINVSVLVAAMKCSPKKQNAHFNLVVGLTFTDICSGLNLLVNGIRLSFSTLYLKPIFCATATVVLSVAILASVTQTFFICFNRLLSISNSSLNKKIFSKRNTYIICVANWATAISLVLIFVDINSIINRQIICNIHTVFGENFEWFRYNYCCCCIVVVALTIFLYFVALHMLRKVSRKTHVSTIAEGIARRDSRNLSDNRTTFDTAESNSTYPSSVSRDTRKISQSMKTVGLIIVALTCLTGPLIIVYFIDTASQPAILLTTNLAVLNSLVNPFLYCHKIKILRIQLRLMFCRCCPL